MGTPWKEGIVWFEVDKERKKEKKKERKKERKLLPFDFQIIHWPKWRQLGRWGQIEHQGLQDQQHLLHYKQTKNQIRGGQK